jgi:hypothetical protein
LLSGAAVSVAAITAALAKTNKVQARYSQIRLRTWQQSSTTMLVGAPDSIMHRLSAPQKYV